MISNAPAILKVADEINVLTTLLENLKRCGPLRQPQHDEPHFYKGINAHLQHIARG